MSKVSISMSDGCCCQVHRTNLATDQVAMLGHVSVCVHGRCLNCPVHGTGKVPVHLLPDIPIKPHPTIDLAWIVSCRCGWGATCDSPEAAAIGAAAHLEPRFRDDMTQATRFLEEALLDMQEGTELTDWEGVENWLLDRDWASDRGGQRK